MAKKRPLGKGLGALINDSQYKKKEKSDNKNFVCEISVNDIEPNPYQPRKEFNEEQLEELAVSIKKLGLVQPITVRKKEEKYQIISGERRWRACKKTGLEKIVAYVRETNNQGLLEMALVENIQRSELNAIEVAVSMQQLIDECKLTQENLSNRIGKKRSTITNYLRLLKLPAEIQIGIRDRIITMGHAKAIMPLEIEEEQINIYKQIVRQALSVRKTEELIRNINKIKKPKQKIELNEKYINVKNKISEQLNTKVEIKYNNKGKGSIIIPFKSEAEWEHISNMLNKLQK